MADPALFLTDAELAQLTGRKLKSKQIAWLRAEAIPFRTNATGHPVVTRSAIDGRPAAPEPVTGWIPRLVGI